MMMVGLHIHIRGKDVAENVVECEDLFVEG